VFLACNQYSNTLSCIRVDGELWLCPAKDAPPDDDDDDDDDDEPVTLHCILRCYKRHAWTESSPDNVPRLNYSKIGLEWSSTTTWTYHPYHQSIYPGNVLHMVCQA